MNPAISVIMPVGNRETYLCEAIESVLAQSFGDFEFLIILDGVSDAVEAIVSSYRDERIRMFKLPVNMGISAARNVGLRVARAPFLALMDSDDMALPERFARQYGWMRRNEDVTVCATNSIKIFENGRTQSATWPESDGVIKARMLIVDSAILNPTTMLRNDFIRRHKIQYDSNCIRDEDHRFFVEMIKNGARFYGLQEELFLYRRHENNITKRRDTVDMEKTRIREIVFPIFFPEITSSASSIFLKGMHENLKITFEDACRFLEVCRQALFEQRSFVGEDRDEVSRIVNAYRNRMLKVVGGKFGVSS